MGRRSRKRNRPDQSRPAQSGGDLDTDARRSRSEQRNAEARARLEPLDEGERPTAVTVAALVAGALALGNLIAYAAGLKVNGERPALSGVVVYEVLLLAAAGGMWRARYWAVLGFEFMLGFLIVFLALFLVRASSLTGVAIVVTIGVPAGLLFWFLIRAMARIQMPERPTRQ